MFQELSRKIILYLGSIVVIGSFLIFSSMWYISRIPKIIPVPLVDKDKPLQEAIIEKQLITLEAFRAQVQPFTEAEIQEQARELEKFRKEQKPLSQEEIQNQIRELEDLRSKLTK